MKLNIKVASKQKKQRELDPAMDWLINAHLQGIGCCHKVFDLHFDNVSALDWREEKMAENYGHSHLIDISPSIIMSDLILNCLVNCAHHEKMKTIEDLHKETHWPATEEYRPEVLNIIHCIIPVKVISVALTNTPLQHGPLSNPLRGGNVALPSTVLVVKKTNRCSACQQEGYNKHNHICPLHPTHNATRTSTTDKENIHVFVQASHLSHILTILCRHYQMI
ncbi:hypothetical protein BDR04DRAFT_1012343 [Suillus decipiens]|nr:hypothetical protein BDR04DRAFT_1012343 [Suillus decipiens]